MEYGVDWYGYGSQNPLRFIDPLGLCDLAAEGRKFDAAYRNWLLFAGNGMGCGPANALVNSCGGSLPYCFDFANALVDALNTKGRSSCCRAVQDRHYYGGDNYNDAWGLHVTVAIECDNDCRDTGAGGRVTIRKYDPYWRNCAGW